MRFPSLLRLGIALCGTRSPVPVQRRDCRCRARARSSGLAQAMRRETGTVSRQGSIGEGRAVAVAIFRARAAPGASPSGQLARAQPDGSPSRKRRRRAAGSDRGRQRRGRPAGGVTRSRSACSVDAALSPHNQRRRRPTLPPGPPFVAWLCLILSSVRGRVPARAAESIRAASGAVSPAQQPR